MSNEEQAENHAKTSRWWENWFSDTNSEPQTKQQIIELLRQAKNRALFNTDALAMLEGVLQVSDLRVRDIMIPRAKMVVLKRDDSFQEIVRIVVESAHSRFPVIDDDKAEVVGTMLAKDLLRYFGQDAEQFKLRDIIRSAVFVPESKPLDVLLKEFRISRNHMAIVVDEYGAAAGLVTIEDVLEQIVGEIEDEHDFDEGAFIMRRDEHAFTVKAHTSIEDFNAHFDTSYTDDDHATIGGLVLSAFGHMPGRGESVKIDHLQFEVVSADSRKIRLLNVLA